LSSQSSALPAAPAGADPGILRSIRQASQATDIDFDYLVAQAKQESGLQPRAAAKSSSARGLFQFIDSTWLEMVRRYGDRYGAGQYAHQISSDSSGRPTVADPGLRRQILGLRDDPSLSAALAAEYARSNKENLEQALGRATTNTDLYLAHFLGAGGATTFLKALKQNSGTVAANLLPGAAAANRTVFYNSKTGAARSVADIYQIFANKIDRGSEAFAVAMSSSPSGAARTNPASGARTSALQTATAPMPLNRPRGPMPLLARAGAQPLVAMFNVMAVTAMKAMSSGITLKKSPDGMRMIAVAPAAPAAVAPRRANQLA